MGDDDELRPVGVAAHELEKAIDVHVVERRLDLVEDVERARAGEEDGEHECERYQRLLTSGEQREALGRLAGGRDLDLDAGVGLVLLGDLGLGRGCSGGLLAGDHRTRRLLGPHQPQPAAAAREQVLHDVLEVLGRRLEGLLEALADAPVGLLDQALELRERRLEVGPLGLQLLDVAHRLLVLLLGQRVDRAELLAATHEALDSQAERLAFLVGQRLVRGLGLEAQPKGDLAQLALDLRRAVAHLLGGDLGRGHGFARGLQATLYLGLLTSKAAQRRGRLLSPGGVALELSREGVAPRANRLGGPIECSRREPAAANDLGVPRGPAAKRIHRSGVLGALLLDPVGQAPLGSQVGEQLGSPHRTGTLVGSLAPARDDPLDPGQRLGRLGLLTRCAPQRDLGLLARRVRRENRLAGLTGGSGGGGLLASRGLRGGHQLVAATALLQHTLSTAHGRLGEPARGAVKQPARAGDGHAGEALGDRKERVDHPDAGQQPVGELAQPVARADVLAQGPSTGRRRSPVAAAPSTGAHERRRTALARAIEPALARREVLHEGRGQDGTERRRQRQLVARLDVQRCGQRGRAVRRRGRDAQELVDRGQLGAGLRGASARGLRRALCLPALVARSLHLLLGLRECRAPSHGGGPQALPGGSCFAALCLQHGYLVAQARLAVALEPAYLALERARAVGRRQCLPCRLRSGVRRRRLGRTRQALVGQRLGLRGGRPLRLGLEQLELA